ncbi:MAG: tetratricopeptide repeat protein, partial [Polyangiales bacterium]
KASALEVTEDALARLAAGRREQAMARFRARDYPGALAAYREAHALDPQDARTHNDLGYLYELLGDRAQAQHFYEKAIALDGGRVIAYLNLSDLLSQNAPDAPTLARAATLLQQARVREGNTRRIVRRQAKVAAQQGRWPEARRHYAKAIAMAGDRDTLRLEFGALLQAAGRDDAAAHWYAQIERHGKHGKTAAERLLELSVRREARRYGWTPPSDTKEATVAPLVQRAEALSAAGQWGEAERVLTRARERQPTSAQAALAFAQLARVQQRGREAERALLQAVSLDPGLAPAQAALGRWYAGQRQHALAVFHLERALALRPGWHAVALDAAESHRLAGHLPEAWLHLTRVRRASHDPALRARAARSLQALTPLMRHLKAQTTAQAGRAAGLGAPTVLRALSRARAQLRLGRSDGALLELSRIPQAQVDRRVHHAIDLLRAEILLAAGRHATARRHVFRALKRAPKPGALLAVLARSYEADGRPARAGRVWHKAARAGLAEGHYHAARLGWQQQQRAPWHKRWVWPAWQRLTRHRQALSTFLAHSRDPVLRPKARALQQSLEHAQRRWAWSLALVLLAVSALMALALHWQRRGMNLTAFVAQRPRAAPELQRILAAIRHEVLKHRGMALSGLADALRHGRATNGLAPHLAESLFGPPTESSAQAKLSGYLEALEALGRSHGCALNLRRRDPLVRAMTAGLRHARRGLALYRRGRDPAALGHLDRATALLTGTAQAGIQTLLAAMRSLTLDAALLRQLEGALGRELGPAGPVPSLHILAGATLPLQLALPRAAFDDIFSNLLRNALQACQRHQAAGAEGLQVGVDVQVVEHPVTALARAQIRLLDNAPEALTRAQLLGRGIEAGLGLAADLVTRWEGSLDVTPADAPWHKAVILELPLAAPTPPDATPPPPTRRPEAAPPHPP